jgi:hypothetical protein
VPIIKRVHRPSAYHHACCTPQTLGALSATAGQRKHDVFARSRVALDCRSFDQFTWVFTTRPYAAPVANKLKAQWANEVEANGPALV